MLGYGQLSVSKEIRSYIRRTNDSTIQRMSIADMERGYEFQFHELSLHQAPKLDDPPEQLASQLVAKGASVTISRSHIWMRIVHILLKLLLVYVLKLFQDVLALSHNLWLLDAFKLLALFGHQASAGLDEEAV